MTTSITGLEAITESYTPQLYQLREEKASSKPAPDKWSKKEIIGHLIDSAHNNLRRFIAGQYEEKPNIIYAQDFWVNASGYQHWPFKDVVLLWELLNRQIISVLKNLPPELYNREVQTQELHSLEWLAADYNKHLKHHLHVALGLEDVPYP